MLNEIRLRQGIPFELEGVTFVVRHVHVPDEGPISVSLCVASDAEREHVLEVGDVFTAQRDNWSLARLDDFPGVGSLVVLRKAEQCACLEWCACGVIRGTRVNAGRWDLREGELVAFPVPVGGPSGDGQCALEAAAVRDGADLGPAGTGLMAPSPSPSPGPDGGARAGLPRHPVDQPGRDRILQGELAHGEGQFTAAPGGLADHRVDGDPRRARSV
ncbi:DUF6406 domain-containing protein [Streptomyces sp. NPDC047023]|uniref:DUF6406 domain-containing protein n=1 Tax=Streptomyces sp. NPDC047023 TaxID=3155139 RepID=UPI0033E536E1